MAQMRITSGKGVHFTFDNGVVLSIQIGGGNYSDNYDEPIGAIERGERGYSLPASRTAEIAVWPEGERDLIDLGGDIVRGYVPVSDVLRFSDFLRDLPAGLDGKALTQAVTAFDWRDTDAA